MLMLTRGSPISPPAALLPPLLLLLLLIATPPAARATLVLTPSPPRGYNTFDAYPDPENLNATFLLDIIGRLAASPLRAANSNYSLIFGWAGWSTTANASGGDAIQHLDAYGRQVPAPERFPPGSMQAAAAAAAAAGLEFGLWQMRGVHRDAVARRLPVKGMEEYTLDQLVDVEPVGGGANGSCLWNSPWLGVNASHPAAQAYYDSVVEGLVELGVSVIEADCFMCGPCYTDEMIMMTSAVKRRPEPLVLYYSPGGGNQPEDGAWVARNQMATFYRTLTDFHGGWYDWAGLQQAVFIAGNFTAAGLHGLNGTWPDLDMLPMGPSWFAPGAPQEQLDRGQTIATLWTIGRYPLMSAGALPLDDTTLGYLTNEAALALNARVEDPASPTRVTYEGNCTCTGGAGSCTIPHGPDDHPARPCVAKWAATVPGAGGFAALALLNVGEDPAQVQTGFAELGLPPLPTARYRVSDLWTGAAVGVFRGNETIATALRMHASVLLQVVDASQP
jgi:alpha-galactosidase